MPLIPVASIPPDGLHGKRYCLASAPRKTWDSVPPVPLNALRAFEAAARHLSFTRAAEELCVTQAAVSHQVKALEARLGHKLFRRSP